MKVEVKHKYEAPSTKKTQVELETGLCAGSAVSIKPSPKGNVEVDEYVSIENDVTFE